MIHPNQGFFMNQQQRLRYLDAMGIQAWQVRSSKPASVAKCGCYCYSLYDVKQSLRVVMLAEAPEAHSASQQLVESIVKAITKRSEGSYVNGYPELSQQVDKLVLLGKDVAKHYQSNDADLLLIEYSLADMLRNSALKRPVWKALQTLVRLYPFHDSA